MRIDASAIPQNRNRVLNREPGVRLTSSLNTHFILSGRTNRRIEIGGWQMTSEQQAVIGTIENALQTVLDAFSEPRLAMIDGINVAREHLLAAQSVLDGIVLQKGTKSAKRSVVDRMIRDIAMRDVNRERLTLRQPS
jgi:hypothetical protein